LDQAVKSNEVRKKIPVLLDGDPGHDDAIAWTIAFASDRLDILGITTAAGNQTIDKTTLNARKILTLLGKNVPVARGATRPLLGELITAGSVHGTSGLDGPKLPDPVIPLAAVPAVTQMADLLSKSEEPVTIVATGPLTNVATLLLTKPGVKEKIARIVFMGGGIAFGNWTAAAEFNILVDPEAADIVLKSGLPLTMCGLDVTESALIFPEDFSAIRKTGGRIARVVADWLEYFYIFHRARGYEGAPLHDAVAVTALIAPEILTVNPMSVQVELSGQYTRGATVADVKGWFRLPRNADVATGIDRDAFAKLLIDHVQRYNRRVDI
jgi:pyrimidine-specific ribonucleoside hydrolase